MPVEVHQLAVDVVDHLNLGRLLGEGESSSARESLHEDRVRSYQGHQFGQQPGFTARPAEGWFDSHGPSTDTAVSPPFKPRAQSLHAPGKRLARTPPNAQTSVKLPVSAPDLLKPVPVRPNALEPLISGLSRRFPAFPGLLKPPVRLRRAIGAIECHALAIAGGLEAITIDQDAG